MLLKCDAAQLEWRVKVLLAQDKIGMEEIASGGDLHTDNQTKFNLPSRFFAKIFIYRMIFADAFGDKGFAGPAYAYANDADFQQASNSPKYWEKVVEAFFNKYKGVHEHSIGLIREATTTGRIVVPSGRYFPFAPEPKRNGDLDWPRTKILNYPVQGFSADLMQVARLLIWERIQRVTAFQEGRVLLINTVHDDVEVDVDNDPDLVYHISILLEEAFRDIPVGFKRLYGSEINVPMAGEVKFGINLNEDSMVKFKKDSFQQDYKDYITKHGSVHIQH